MSVSVAHAEHDGSSNACLHLLMSASSDAVRDCLQHAAAGDSVLLLDTAVALLLHPAFAGNLPKGISVFAAKADVEARALPGLVQGNWLDDQEWAGLVYRHAHCLTWK